MQSVVRAASIGQLARATAVGVPAGQVQITVNNFTLEKIFRNVNFNAGKLYENIIRLKVCPGSSDPSYIVAYYIKWVTTSWTHSNYKISCRAVGCTVG